MPTVEAPPRTLELTVLMTPETANFAGNVHGGHLLKVLDQVASSCASRDENGDAIAVPQFEPVTQLDRKRWDEAEQRRAVRLADPSTDR